MKTFLALLVASLGCVATSQAFLVTYGNEAAFNAASTTTAQTFSYPNASYGALPNNQMFPGFTVSASGTHSGNELFFAGPNSVVGNSNSIIGLNYSEDSLNIIFTSGQTAVAFGLLSAYGNSSTFTISIYDTSNMLVATIMQAVTRTGNGTFFGLTAGGGDMIGRVSFLSNSGAPMVDLVRYGTAGSAGVPEGGATVILLGLALGSLTLARRKLQL